MRQDILIKSTLAKCDTLQRTGIWAPSIRIRPAAWLENFDSHDKHIAAILLDNFIFYSDRLTDELFRSAFLSLCDGLPKSGKPIESSRIREALKTAVYTLVTGEEPNVTDSGYTFCRKARQRLGISQSRQVFPEKALEYASRGQTVVFLDDFIGSGDQFVTMWHRPCPKTGESFASLFSKKPFLAIYVSLVTTDYGLQEIYRRVPNVIVSPAHIVGEKYTYRQISDNPETQLRVNRFLIHYAELLAPEELYMQDPEYKAFGYKSRGLMFGFEHSIPDATLPIFWAPGKNTWEPLIERL